MRTVHTFCRYHLGDNLIHLNYTRRLALAYPDVCFVHAADKHYLRQLREVVEDIPRIALVPLEEAGAEAVDVWKNRKGDFYGHRLQADWVNYHLEFFDKLSLDLGFKTPIRCPDDLLFDYPAIKMISSGVFNSEILIINSPPLSGQCQAPGDFNWLIPGLVDRGHSVITTAFSQFPHRAPTTSATVSCIGAMSLHCKYIIGHATGPIWPTFNIWNKDTCERIIFLDSERINLCPNTTHVRNVNQALAILSARGLM